MKTIYLHGKLGQEFGKKWTLNAKTLPEMFHAINCNKEGFLDHLLKDIDDGVKYLVLKKSCETINSQEELTENIISEKDVELETKDKEFHLVAAAEGGVEVFVAGLIEWFAVENIITVIVMSAISYGIAALMKPPEPEKVKKNTATSRSYVLNGAQERYSQGSPVPVGYGRLIVGPNNVGHNSLFKKYEGPETQKRKDELIQSYSEVQYLDLLCEGPIEGFSDDLGNTIADPSNYDKAVYLDKTPVKNSKGMLNFVLTENKKENHEDVIKISKGEEDSYEAKTIFNKVSYAKDFNVLLYGPKPYTSQNSDYQSERFAGLGYDKNKNEHIIDSVTGDQIVRAKNPFSSMDFDEIEFAKQNGAKIFSHIVTNVNVNEVSINFQLQMERKDRQGNNYSNFCDFIILIQSAGEEYNVLDPRSGCVVSYNNNEPIALSGYLRQIITDGSDATSYKADFGQHYWNKLTEVEKSKKVFPPIITNSESNDRIRQSYELFVDNNPEVLRDFSIYSKDRQYFRVFGIASQFFEFSINIRFEWLEVTERLNAGMTFKVIKLSNEYDPSATAPEGSFVQPDKKGKNMHLVGKILAGPRDNITSEWNSIDGTLNNRVLKISNILEKIDENFIYPNSAMCSLKFDSRNFSSVPDRSYHLKLKKLLLPSNYNQYSRKYEGSWDGLFKGQSEGQSIYAISDTDKYWSDNPAWVFFDILSNPRFGLAKYGLEYENIDKWQLYKIAKYCDELVQTGYAFENKSLTPRPFSCSNNLIHDENLHAEGYMKINIEDYFWYLDESGNPRYSEKKYDSASYTPEGLSRTDLINETNINILYNDLLDRDATEEEKGEYLNQQITVSGLISILISENNELSSRIFSDTDFKQEFGDEQSFKGKRMVFFIAKKDGDSTTLKDLQKRACLRRGLFDIEERTILKSSVSERAVWVAGPAFDFSTFVGGCSVQINYPLVEPRFTTNVYLTSKDEALSVLNGLSSVFRGMLSYFGGKVSVSMDYPKTPIRLFTNSNVSKGGFSYSGEPKSKKISSCIVRFNNKEKAFAPDIVFEEDPSLIQKFGFSQKEIIGQGITSRSQAQRLARWALLTSNLEGENIRFTTSYEANYLVPGSIFEVSDEMRSGKYKSGRIKNIGYLNTGEPYIEIDKQSAVLGGMSRVEITISCGNPSSEEEKINIRSLSGSYASSNDQDVDIENRSSSQIIKFEGTLRLGGDKGKKLEAQKNIVTDLLFKIPIIVSVKDNTFESYNHGLVERQRVRFMSDGVLPSGLSASRIYEKSYKVYNVSKNTFQLRNDTGQIVYILDEGYDFLGNKGGVHYVCPENINGPSSLLLDNLDQVLEGSTYSLKNYVAPYISGEEAEEEGLSSLELELIGVDGDFVAIGQWVFSRYFGNINILNRQWIYANNLGFIGIENALQRKNKSQIWFYSDNVGWIMIAEGSITPSGDYNFYLPNYENHEYISPWVMFVKNELNNIDRVYIRHKNQGVFLAYAKKSNHEIQTLGETDSIFIGQESNQELKSSWNSGSLLLSVDEYNSLPDHEDIKVFALNRSLFLGKNSFEFAYFYLGRAEQDGQRLKVNSIMQKNFIELHYPGRSSSFSYNPSAFMQLTSPGYNPGTTLVAIKNFEYIDSSESLSGLDAVRVVFNENHGLNLSDNINLLIEDVIQSNENTDFVDSINGEWETFFINDNVVELSNSIVAKENLQNNYGYISSFGNVRHVNLLSRSSDSYFERKLYRTLKIKENTEGKYEIIGSEYNLNKFNAVDKNYSVVKPYLPIPPQADMGIPDAPSDLELYDLTKRDFE